MSEKQDVTAEDKDMKKGKPKAYKAVLCFFLGFLFALIVVAGSVLGAGLIVWNTPTDKVLDRLGLPNVDEEGNNVYVNTDEKDGMPYVKDIIASVGEVIDNADTLCIDKIQSLVPAVDKLLDTVYGYVDEVVTLDKDKFESAPVTEYLQIINDALLNVHTAKLLNKLDVQSVTGEDSNKILKTILMGAEAQYAAVNGNDRLKLPVLFDYYTYNESIMSYNREVAVDGDDRLYGDESFLCEVEKDKDGNKRYKYYYVPCKITADGIAEAEYVKQLYTVTEGDVKYNFSVISFGEGTDFIAVKPDEEGNFSLDFAAVSADKQAYEYHEVYARNYYRNVKNSENKKAELVTLSGINYFYDNAGNMVEYDPLLIYDLLVNPCASLYSVYVSELFGEEESGDSEDVKTVKELLGDTTLGELLEGGANLKDDINEIEISRFIDVSAKDSVMAYIGYGITGVTAQSGTDSGKNYGYTAYCNTEAGKTLCYVSEKNGKISEVWYGAGDETVQVKGTKIGDISARFENLKEDMTIGEIITISDSDSKILQLIKDTPLSGLDGKIQSLTVGDMFSDSEIEASSLLKQLRTEKLTDLKTAIDGLLVQRVYCKDIYNLPQDGQPMEVVEFNPDYKYYTAQKQQDGSVTLIETPIASAADMDGNINYFTYGGQEGQPQATLKIAGYAGGYKGGWLYYEKDADGNFALVNDSAEGAERGRLTAQQASAAFESGRYYSFGQATGMWKIMLYKDGAEKAYTIDNFNNLVATCTLNLYGATLGELQNAGVIGKTTSDGKPLDLEKTLPALGKKLKDIKLSELVEYSLSLAN